MNADCFQGVTTTQLVVAETPSGPPFLGCFYIMKVSPMMYISVGNAQTGIHDLCILT